ncbi:hypothetical protein ACFQ51_04140 [Streptomyces kaempferi]
MGFQPVTPELPEQGWKIHVAARLDNAPHVLEVVRRYCFDNGVAYKFLRSPGLVQTQNAKYAARASSGKFLTLYPRDDAALEHCLSNLDAALDGAPGPYILSDLRWRKGPLYLRYGGFVEQFCRSETGELVLAFREPSGKLRPDVRAAVFEVPPWAPVPAVLADTLAAASRTSVDDFPYTVQSALHFSNGGGIYLARRTTDGQQVVLKEARPHAASTSGATTRSPDWTSSTRRSAGWPDWTPCRRCWADSPPGNTTSWCRSTSRASRCTAGSAVTTPWSTPR